MDRHKKVGMAVLTATLFCACSDQRSPVTSEAVKNIVLEESIQKDIEKESDLAEAIFFSDPSNVQIRDDAKLRSAWESEQLEIYSDAYAKGLDMKSLDLMQAAKKRMISKGILRSNVVATPPPPASTPPWEMEYAPPKAMDKEVAWRQTQEVFFSDPANALIRSDDALFDSFERALQEVADNAARNNYVLTDMQLLRGARQRLVEQGLIISPQ